MLLKKGIVRRTFLFSALLIILVILISFAVLYFAMPQYYLYKKEQVLQDNLDRLVTELKASETQEKCASLISDFIEANNASVISFDPNDTPLLELSTPFVSMQSGGKVNSFLKITRKQNGAEQEVIIKSNALFTSGKALSLRGDIGTPLIDYVMVGGTLQPIDEAKDVVLSLIPYILFIGIAIGLSLSLIYARQISKPILKISGAAVRMQRMEPEAMSGIHTSDELGQLSENLDALYASLLQNIDSLKKETEKANRLERFKTEMMQSASHELKTPIAALSGMLDGMLDNIGVYKNRDKYLSECKEQVEKLSLLVSEILNASKADMQEEEIVLEDTAIDELTKRALADYALTIDEKCLQVSKELPHTVIASDSSVLYRIITNLISNAVRYTPKSGKISIALSKERFSIENQCAHISKEELDKLLEPFYTRSYNRDKAKSGTGLGLYIVKRNLERLNMKYKLEQTEQGLKFSIFL